MRVNEESREMSVSWSLAVEKTRESEMVLSHDNREIMGGIVL